MKKVNLLLLIFGVILLAACGSADAGGPAPGMAAVPYTRKAYPMGTYAELRVWNKGKDEVLDLALDRIFELETLLNVNADSRTKASEVEQINQNAGIGPVKVSESTFFLIKQAVDFSYGSDGVFNAAIGPLTKLWSIGFPEARRPSDEEITETLPLLDYQKIILDEEHQTVFLEEEGMRFDLGAIAKGYMADEVARIFAGHGVTSAIIDLGGNIIAVGRNAKGNEWRIGIQDPFDNRGQAAVTFLTENKSVVTSGVYERYLEDNGEIYHHILNGKTGFPFDNGVAGVTIISDRSIDGDKYTTLAFGLGIESGLETIENIDGLEAIYINFQQEIYCTSGLHGKLQLENKKFKLMN